MDRAIPEAHLQDILDRTLRQVTQTSAGIRLQRGGSGPDGAELCTVYTVFERGFGSALALCADAALFTRLARHMLCMDDVTPQDVEDFAKEYFNVVCGHIVAELYRCTSISARFQIPGFCRARYAPQDRRELFALTYTGDRDEAARLIHYTCVPETK